MLYTDDGWFKLSANDTASPEDFFEVPGEVEVKPEKSGFTDFGKITEIPLEYMTLRQSVKTCGISISEGKLHIQGGNSLASKYNQGLLARRHQHHSYDFTAKMEFDPGDYCHMAGIVCYYNYDNNINYQANLNLQAYVIDYDGVDSFFYFLLNLGQLRNRTALPNDIGYCMNHGLSTYNVHANYRLDDENPVRIEVLYNYTKLLSRIDLSYNHPLN